MSLLSIGKFKDEFSLLYCRNAAAEVFHQKPRSVFENHQIADDQGVGAGARAERPTPDYVRLNVDGPDGERLNEVTHG